MRQLTIWIVTGCAIALAALTSLRPQPAPDIGPAPAVGSDSRTPEAAVLGPRLPTGTREPACLVGTVVDAAGDPIPGASVTLVLYRDGTRELIPGHHVAVTSDDHGRFVVEPQLPQGVWNVYLDQRLGESSPAQITIGTRPDAGSPVQIRSGRRVLQICGRVVDENGVAAAGVWIGSGTTPLWDTISSSDGTFVVLSREGADSRQPVMLDFAGAEFYPQAGVPPFAWGTDSATVVLRRRGFGDVDVVVTDARTGAPVDRFEVRGARDPRDPAVPSAGPNTFYARPGAHHPPGRIRLRGLRGGRHLLFVRPTGEGLVPSEVVGIDVRAGSTSTCEITLQPGVDVPIEVARVDGSPVAATSVELVCTLDPTDLRSIDGSMRANAPEAVFAPAWFGDLLQGARARTDSRGRASLRCATSDRGYTLRVNAPDHEPFVLPGVVVGPSPEPIRVVVQDYATLRVRFGGADSSPAASAPPSTEIAGIGRVQLYEVAASPRGPILGTRDAELVHGALQIGNIPAGTWRVRVRPAYREGGAWRDSPFFTEVAVLDLAPGAVSELRVDPDEYRPGRLRARVSLHGRTAVDYELELVRGAPGDRYPRVRIDSTSRCVLESIQPGVYTAVLHTATAGVPAAVPITIDAGAVLDDVEIAFEAPRLRLRLVDRHGRPVSRRRVRVADESGVGYAEASTGVDGVAHFALVPRGVLSVAVLPTAQELQGQGDCGRRPSPPRSIEPIEVTVRDGEVRVERVWSGP